MYLLYPFSKQKCTWNPLCKEDILLCSGWKEAEEEARRPKGNTCYHETDIIFHVLPDHTDFSFSCGQQSLTWQSIGAKYELLQEQTVGRLRQHSSLMWKFTPADISSPFPSPVIVSQPYHLLLLGALRLGPWVLTLSCCSWPLNAWGTISCHQTRRWAGRMPYCHLSLPCFLLFCFAFCYINKKQILLHGIST